MQRVEVSAGPPVVGGSPATGGDAVRRAWMPLAHAAWVLLVLIAVTLVVMGMRQREINMRWLYWGSVEAAAVQGLDGTVRLSPIRGGGVARAGVLEGDELVAIDDVAFTSADDADARLHNLSGPVKLTVRTGSHPPHTYTLAPLGAEGLLLQDSGLSPQLVPAVVLLFDLFFGLVCLVVAVVIFVKRAADWLAVLVSAAIVVALFGLSLPVLALFNTRPELTRALDAWASLGVMLLLLFFFLFPDGRFRPRWAAPFSLIIALLWLAPLFNEAWYPWRLAPAIQAPLTVALLGSGAAALVYRYRFGASAEQRQQIRWVVLGGTTAAAGLLLQVLPLTLTSELQPRAQVLYDLLLFPTGQALRALLPVSIAIAILRYHLWDITLVINRTLVYGLLTFCVIMLYALVVGVVNAVLPTTNGLATSLVATGVNTLAFQPLRLRLQAGVDRLMYGERDNPYAVLGRLGRRLEGTLVPEAVLPTLVETIAQALKLPYVAITSPPGPADSPGGKVEASYGQPAAAAATLPLHYQGETVGELVASARQRGESLNQADLNLLASIASQAGAAIHSVRLTAALQQSRERLVATREEERRRLRRDLHDGLGPVLAAMAMEADAAHDAVASHPDEAAALLVDITTKAQAALQDIRQLVYGLRPPALDELGPAGAIRQQAGAYAGLLVVDVRAPETMGPLPAAVEVAAYRIAVEALNNAAQHAGAGSCTVTITRTATPKAALVLEIRDDGAGLEPGHKHGVGLISMRERAAELGGTCTVEPAPAGGTLVTARLPLPAPAAVEP